MILAQKQQQGEKVCVKTRKHAGQWEGLDVGDRFTSLYRQVAFQAEPAIKKPPSAQS
jgi:hypothetical protein